MDPYKLVTVCHVVFTLLAFASGLIAIIAPQKGGIVHRKSGRFYFYFYIGVVLTGYLLLAIKFKIFFLGLTLFGTYLIFSGNYYAKRNEKVVDRNWWLLSILIMAIFVHTIDVIFALSNIVHIGYGWLAVRIVYAIIPVSVLIFELAATRKRYLLHAVMMLLSFIPLVDGLLARLSAEEYVWVFWIFGYIVFIPLILLWFRKSKELQLLLK